MMNKLSGKYGVTEKRQEELNLLADKVKDAEYQVDEIQAIVASLAKKSETFQEYLGNAENNKETALINLNLLKDVVGQVSDVVNNSEIVAGKAGEADNRTQLTARELAALVEELLFTAEYINKLGQVINKKKALVPMISDELIKIMNVASKDANNAVATTLTALKSCYAAAASSKGSLEATGLELLQSRELLRHLTGNDNRETNSDVAGQSLAEVAAAEAQITAVLARISVLEADRKTASEDVENVQAEVIEREKLIQTAQDDLDELERQLAAFLCETDQCEHALLQAERDLLSAQEEFDKGDEADRERLNALLDDSLEKQIACEQDLNKARANGQTAKNTFDETVRAIASAQNKLAQNNAKRRARQNAESAATKALSTEYTSLEEAKMAFDQAINRLGKHLTAMPMTPEGQKKTCLEYLLTHAYKEAVEKYRAELSANARVTRELEVAKAKLMVVTNKLSALQAGLKAATAASLAA